MEKRGFMIGHIDAWDGRFEQTKSKENINQGLKTNKEESKQQKPHGYSCKNSEAQKKEFFPSKDT